MKKKLSFVIPVYNEEGNLLLFYEKLREICEKMLSYNVEIIFINDGSLDDSWQLINKLSSLDPRVRGFSFSRNFGFQMALTAGYDYAQGDACITLDADLQHPPELIEQMVKKWEEGALIVYTRTLSRDDGFLKKITAFLYYKLLHLVSDMAIPQHVGDFRLIDKTVLNQIRLCREKARYLRGLVAWTGFRHAYVMFNQPKRLVGVSGYTWSKLIKLAFDGIAGFSLFPLRIAAFMGVFVVVTGSLMFTYIAFDAFLFGSRYPLFKWLVTINYIFMGVQFLLMWLLGEYIGRMYDQQKNRPLYIIEKSVGLGFEER